MSSPTSAARLHRTVAGSALLLGPVLFAAAELTGPELTGSSASQVAQLAAHRTQQVAASLLSIATAMVLLVGVLGAVHLVRRRSVVLASVAATLIVYGLVAAHAALGGVNLVFAELGTPALDRSAMVALHDTITHDAAVGAPLLLGHYALAIGVLLLGVALWRSGVGPRWAAICVVLFPVSDVLASFLPVPGAADWISNGFGVVGLGALGLTVLRMGDAEWDAPSTPAHEPSLATA
jgi:hypothetical protein